MNRLAAAALLWSVVWCGNAWAAGPAPVRAWKGVDARLLELERGVEARAGDTLVLGLLHQRAAWRDEETGPQRLNAFLQRLVKGKTAHPLVKDHARLLLARLALEAGDKKIAAQALAEAGVIPGYLVLGPFENAGGSMFSATLGVEDQPGLGRPHDGLSRAVRWRAVEDVGPSGMLALHDHLWPNDDALAAALVFVQAPQAMDVALRVAASDQLEVWVNGARRLSSDTMHPAAWDQHVVAVHLEAGWNRVLFKVGQLRGAWMLGARLTALDGSALTGVVTSTRVDLEGQAAGASATASASSAVDPVARAREAAAGGVAADLEAAHALFAALRVEDERQRPAPRQAWLAAALQQRPEDPQLLVALAEEQPDDDVNAARELLERALAASPGYAPALTALGRLRLRQDLPVQGRRLLQAAMAADKTFSRAAVAYWEQRANEGPDAQQPARELAALAKKRPTLAALEAWMRMEQNRGALAKAREVASEIRKKWPAHRGARAVYQDVARKTGDWAALEVEARAALALDPHGETTVIQMAEVLLTQGRAAEALKLLDAHCQGHPDATEARVRLGEARQAAGDIAGTLQAWNAALALKPQDAPLRRHVEALQSAQRFESRHGLDVEALMKAPPPPGAQQAGAYVLGHVVAVRLYENGLTTQVVDVAYRLLDRARAPMVEQLRASYVPGRESLDVLRAERITADGQVFPADIQESDPSGREMGVYSDRRRVTVDFGALQAGDVVRLRYRLDAAGERNLFGDFFGLVEYAQEVVPKAFYDVVVEAPPARVLSTAVSRLQPFVRTQKDDVVTYRSRTAPLAALVVEPAMPPYPDVGAYAMVSSYARWEDMGRWYQGLIRDQLMLDETLRRTAEELVAGATSDDEKIRRIHRWVLRKTRYVGIELGIHGWKPYRVTQVVARGYGDCKDKASLLVAMLKHVGVDARLTLLRTADLGVLVDLPSMWAFNHAIAYVPSKRLFLDGTAEFSGTAELPHQDQEAQALTVDVATGAVERVSPALMASTATTNQSNYVLTVAPDGAVTFQGQEAFTGNRAPDERARLQDPATQKQVMEKDLSQLYPGAQVETAKVSDPADLDAPLTYQFSGVIPAFGAPEAGGLTVPITLYPHGLEREYAPTPTRTHDVVLAYASMTRNRMRFVLPPGFTAANLPQTTRINTPHLEFAQVITVNPDGYTVEETLHVKSRRIPVKAYAAFRQAVVDADRRMKVRVRLVPAAGRAP